MSLRTGVRLALDWGDARIGVAKCDASGTLAFPLTTVKAGDTELRDLTAIVVEEEPLEVIVGLPRSLSGGEGPAAIKVRARAEALVQALAGVLPAQVPVRLIDERLTTVTASRRLSESGKKVKQQRSIIDAAAAVTILEHALEVERARGAAPGELVSAEDPA